jgi:hypothetical protein
MTDATDELRDLSRVLMAHAKALRKAADMARERGAVLREVSRILRDKAAVKREQAEAARMRHAVNPIS